MGNHSHPDVSITGWMLDWWTTGIHRNMRIHWNKHQFTFNGVLFTRKINHTHVCFIWLEYYRCLILIIGMLKICMGNRHWWKKITLKISWPLGPCTPSSNISEISLMISAKISSNGNSNIYIYNRDKLASLVTCCTGIAWHLPIVSISI